jgi:cyclopropane-fatty-acyl-phospholipid synthase
MDLNRETDQGCSKEAIQFHYDKGNAFYQLWLDSTMSYSSALWEGCRTLEEAQLNKLDYHIRQARADTAQRVLDIGCGWGGLLQRLLERHPVKQVVGLTLSQEQVSYVEQHRDHRIQVRLESWEDHTPTSPYDAIISIGAFEHFARPELGRAAKVARYRDFFKSCHGMLVPDGRLSLQTICYGISQYTREYVQDLKFMTREIFPESALPILEEILPAVGRLFEVELVRNDRLDYARTCYTWLQSLLAKREQCVAVVGPETVAKYERYLRICVRMFQAEAIGLWRLTLRRITRKHKADRYPLPTAM